MRLTRRGWAVVAVAVGGMVLSAAFGPRSLNAVVFPAVIALVAAGVQLRLLSRPTVRRTVPEDGFPGDTGTVTLTFDTGSPFTGHVRDTLRDGIDATAGADVETAVGVDPMTYEVTYRSRGRHTIGPVQFVARDVLGLAATSFTVASTATVVVYPNLRALSGTARRDLFALSDPDVTSERDEFDRLRQYERGDSLRDIHWKSSAKRDDLVVQEFTADAAARSVTVSAGASAGGDDAMADAAASIAVELLDGGVPVHLSTPGGEVDAEGTDGRRQLLEQLAVAKRGPVPDPDADIVVKAQGRTTSVRIGGMETTFERLAAGGEPSRTRREVPA